MSYTPTPRCPICRETLYEWKNPHRCPPRWEVIRPDYDDPEEPNNCYSHHIDHEQVAEQFIAERFDGEGSEWEVWVRKDESEEWQKFTVTVEPVPSFTAVRKECEQ